MNNLSDLQRNSLKINKIITKSVLRQKRILPREKSAERKLR